MIATGNLLAGTKNASSGQLMDSMYSSWNNDSVHGEKVAYTRIGLGLLDIIKKEPSREQGNNPYPRKRGRYDSSPPPLPHGSRDQHRGRDHDCNRNSYRRDESTSSTRSSRERSAYTAILVTSSAAGAAPLAAAAAWVATTSMVERAPPPLQFTPAEPSGTPTGSPC
jgi:hypothetical protein